MNKQFLRFNFFLLMYLTLPLITTAQVVSIPNLFRPRLRSVKLLNWIRFTSSGLMWKDCLLWHQRR